MECDIGRLLKKAGEIMFQLHQDHRFNVTLHDITCEQYYAMRVLEEAARKAAKQ